MDIRMSAWTVGRIGCFENLVWALTETLPGVLGKLVGNGLS